MILGLYEGQISLLTNHKYYNKDKVVGVCYAHISDWMLLTPFGQHVRRRSTIKNSQPSCLLKCHVAAQQLVWNVHFNVRQSGGDGFFFSSPSFLSPAVGTCS
jgi:hypothetical protein